LTDDDARSENVHGGENGHFVAAHYEDRSDERHNKSSVKHTGCLECFESEDLTGISEVVWEVKEKHEELSSQDTGNGAIEGKIRDVVGIHTGAFGQTQHDKEASQKT
jgi:hypothetical protein